MYPIKEITQSKIRDITRQSISWPLVSVLLLLMLGNNLFSKITLLACLVYFGYKNIRDLKSIIQSMATAIWLSLFMLWTASSFLWSVVPEVTLSLVVTQLAFFVLSALVANYAVKQDLNNTFKITGIIVLCLIISYALAFPSASMSSQGFKSFYSNKNNLGVILGICIIFIAFTNKIKWYEYGFIATALLMLVLSQSKTSLTTIISVTLILITSLLAKNKFDKISDFAKGMLRLIFKPVIFVIYILISLMIFFREIIADYIIQILPYEFLTGRGELWLMVLKRTDEDLLTGLGPGSFWNAGQSSEVAQTYLLSKAPLWIEKLSSSDGGYIDIIGTLGFIGFALFVLSITENYRRLFKASNDSTKKFLIAIITFFTIHNTTETTVLHSTNSLWFIYLFSTFYIIIKNQQVDIANKS